jgi:hypothetical protein
LRAEGFEAQAISVIGCYPCRSCMAGLTVDDRLAGSGALDSVVGWLSGADVLNSPSCGSYLVAGPIKKAFAPSLGQRHTITDALASLRVPEYQAMVYEALVSEHGVIIAVHVADRKQYEKALKMMKQMKAIVVTPN